MKSIFLKDMAYRRARVILTAIGITLLIMLILFLGGIMNGMQTQAKQYVESTGADIWISAEGSGGAFIGFSLLIPEYLVFLNNQIGLVPKSAAPLVFAQGRPIIRGVPGKAIIVGYQKGKLGGPDKVIEGQMFTSSQYDDYRPEDIPTPEVVIDEKMNLEIGEKIVIGGKELKVVGKAKSLMFVLDTPLLFMDVRTAQDVLLENYLNVNMMLAKTADNFSPDDIAKQLDQNGMIEVRTLKQTVDDIIEYYVINPMRAVRFLQVMLWLASGILVGMITYVTTLEKTQEIGVLKAIGASNGYVVQLILKQVAVISILGIVCGTALSYVAATFAPIFVEINPIHAVFIPAVSFAVCCFSGYLAGRKAMTVDPMVAFRGEI